MLDLQSQKDTTNVEIGFFPKRRKEGLEKLVVSRVVITLEGRRVSHNMVRQNKRTEGISGKNQKERRKIVHLMPNHDNQ